MRTYTAADQAVLGSVIAGLPAYRAWQKLNGPVIVEANPDPMLARWREKADDPRTICVEKDGVMGIAWMGDEPTYAEIRRDSWRFGHRGQGFAFLGFDGDVLVTHNLWSTEEVPAEYRHLFKPTHVRMLPWTPAQEADYWAKFDPFADGEAA